MNFDNFRLNPNLIKADGLMSSRPFEINTIFVEVARDVLNALGRGYRNQVFKEKISKNFNGLRIVEEGDSWFQHPVAYDLMDFLIPHRDNRFAIYSLSAAGDTLGSIIRQKEISSAVKETGAHVLLLSAGGNDLLGNAKLVDYLEPPFVNATQKDLIGIKFYGLLKKIMKMYESLLSDLLRKHSDLVIFVHGYARPFPKKGYNAIYNPLKEGRIWPLELQSRVMQVIAGEFDYAMKGMAKKRKFGGRVVYVDLTLLSREPSDFADEIHLSKSNCRAAANILINTVVKDMANRGFDFNHNLVS